MEVNRYPSSLLTDLYQLTMAQVYFQERMFQPATFSLFIRDYPPDRGYFVSAGLGNVLDFLASIQAPATYAIEISERLSRQQKKVRHRVIEKELGES